MKDERIIRPTHTLLLPYGQTICGKMFTMTLEATFECEKLHDPEIGYYMDLKIIKLTGKDNLRRVYNMMQLVEAEDEITQCLMECLLYNEKYWNESYLWWCDDKPK